MKADLVVAGEVIEANGPLQLGQRVAGGAERAQAHLVQHQPGAIPRQMFREHQIPRLQRIEMAVNTLVQIDPAATAAGVEVGQRAIEALPRL